MLPLPDFDQLQELFRDPIQRRYAIIRPLVLFHDRTATQRAEDKPRHDILSTSSDLSRLDFRG